MRIALDVAQTCVEKAGCAWAAQACAAALLAHEGGPQYLLYHQFGAWVNADTSAGFRPAAGVAGSPLLGTGPDEARALWARVAAGVAEPPGDPDLVHSFSYQAPATGRARLVFTLNDVTFWTHPECHTEGNRLLCERGTLEALRNASGFHFPSRHSRDEFNRVLGGWLDASGLPEAVIPYGSRFEPSPREPGAGGDYWLFVGSLEPRKNIGAALDALELHHAAGGRLPLAIAGGGGWRSTELQARIASMEARGLVRRLGYVPDDRLCALYRGARALLFPSWAEGFGLPVLEAMGQGCPVVCSDRSSLPEVGGEAVAYADPSRPDAMALAMDRLDRDPAARERASRMGHARALDFGWPRIARSLAAFYRTVLAR